MTPTDAHSPHSFALVPRFGAERVMRVKRGVLEGPLGIVAERANAQVITSLNLAASAVELQTFWGSWQGGLPLPMAKGAFDRWTISLKAQ